MTALIEGLPLTLYLIKVEEGDLVNGIPYLGIHLGPVSNGTDWQVLCPKLRLLLLDSSEKTSSTTYCNSAFRFALAADYIEEYPDSVSVYRRWGDRSLPPTAEFLALVLRSVVE